MGTFQLISFTPTSLVLRPLPSGSAVRSCCTPRATKIRMMSGCLKIRWMCSPGVRGPMKTTTSATLRAARTLNMRDLGCSISPRVGGVWSPPAFHVCIDAKLGLTCVCLLTGVRRRHTCYDCAHVSVVRGKTMATGGATVMTSHTVVSVTPMHRRRAARTASRATETSTSHVHFKYYVAPLCHMPSAPLCCVLQCG